ncbi:MAG: NAD(P)-dependent oxidoreductase [Actinocrinis sp.]
MAADNDGTSGNTAAASPAASGTAHAAPADMASGGAASAGGASVPGTAVLSGSAPNAMNNTIGWIGTGRMGAALVTRLLGAGQQVTVYNRTRVKAEELVPLGAKVVDGPAELADCRIVFISVDTPASLVSVATALFGGESGPRTVVDCSTVDAPAARALRELAAKTDTAVIAAPISGNAGAVTGGTASFCVSGPQDAYQQVLALLEILGRSVSYVGEGDSARVVKLAHNMLLGVVAQTLAEVSTLAQRYGVSRTALMQFLNSSVLGSDFTRYKTPAMLALDWSPTFTTELLRKDFDLGLAAARVVETPMPVAAAAYQRIQEAVTSGFREADIAALLEVQAHGAGVELRPEGGQHS